MTSLMARGFRPPVSWENGRFAPHPQTPFDVSPSIPPSTQTVIPQPGCSSSAPAVIHAVPARGRALAIRFPLLPSWLSPSPGGARGSKLFGPATSGYPNMPSIGLN